MSEEAVVIQIELETNMNETFVQMEKASGETGTVVSKNISQRLTKTLNKSVEQSSKKIGLLTKTIDGLGKAMVLVAANPTLFSAINKKFKITETLSKKLGIALNELFSKFVVFRKAFEGFKQGEVSLLELKVAFGKLLNVFGIANSKLLDLVDVFFKLKGFGAIIASAFGPLTVLGGAFGLLKGNLKETVSLTRTLAAVKFKPKGLFGLTAVLGDVSIALGILSAATADSESKFLQITSKVALFASIIAGSLSIALTAAILKVAELGRAVSGKLITFFQETSKAFNKSEKDALVFAAAIESINRANGNVLGSTAEMNKEVSVIADTFNVAGGEVQKAAQEMSLVGTRIGLTRDQIIELTRASVELAKVNKKDVFQTTVNVANALNGNAAALSAYGIKLNQAAVQQFAFAKGQKKQLSSLTESEVVGLRFNKFMKQYNEIAGVGIVAANSLADQQEKLKRTIQETNESLGEGARIIEDNNIIAFLYNKVLGNLNQTFFKFAGFIGALGARLLQVGSIVLALSFKFFLVARAYTTFNKVLASSFAIQNLAKTIPFIGKSVNDMATALAGSKTELKSVAGLASFLAKTIKNQLGFAFTFLTGTTFGTATAMQVLQGSMLRAAAAANYLKVTLIPLVAPYLAIAAAVAAVVAVFYTIYKAMEAVEEQTGALSTLWNVLVDTFTSSGTAFATVGTFLGNLKDSIILLAKQGFGILVSGMIKVVGVITAIAQKNPFGVFSKKSVAALTNLDSKLKSFQENLVAAGYNMGNLGLAAGRSLASGMAKGFNLKEIISKLNAVENALVNAGLSQKEIIVRIAGEQREAVKLALDAGVIDQMRASELIKKIKLDETTKILALNKNQESSYEKLKNAIDKQLRQGAVRLMSAAFQEMGNAMAGNASGWNAFLGTILSILGDLAISMGVTIIATAEAITALKASLLGDSISPIILGGGLIALGAILKSVGSAKGGDSSAGFTGGGAGGGIASPSGSTGAATSAVADSGERQAAQTNVSLIVNGDILDSPDTGKRLAKVLSESFAKDGIVLNNAGVA